MRDLLPPVVLGVQHSAQENQSSCRKTGAHSDAAKLKLVVGKLSDTILRYEKGDVSSF